ncbi:MAG: pseudouridine synthase [Bryobacteraceae bacterium]
MGFDFTCGNLAKDAIGHKGYPNNMPEAEVRLKTLDRVLSKAGLGSRTDATKWILAGRVTLNGAIVKTPDQWVNPKRDRIALDGKTLKEQKKMYVLLYKPKGYITTRKDPEGRPTVYDLIRDYRGWLTPVGRLDQDTSGLLILTNDNDFADFVTSPESHVAKTYLVKTSSLLSADALDHLRQGVELADGPTRPAEVKHLRNSAGATFLEITLTEGRNRQVRRMIEAIGSKVRKLVRTSIGQVEISGLEMGRWRELAPAEVEALRRKARAK